MLYVAPTLTEQEKKERWLKMEVVVDYKEFDCVDCHVHVFTWADDPRTRCAVCSWIKQMPNITPEEEAEIRVITCTPILEKNNDN
jgi:competence transcription factor ComK